MKTFNDLKNEELLELTEEDIDRYIDIQMVEKGLPLELSELVEPEPIERFTDEVFCKIENMDSTWFRPEIANKILEIIRSNNVYHRGWGEGRPKLLKSNDSYNYPVIQQQGFESIERIEKEATKRKMREDAFEAYKERREHNDSVLTNRGEIRENLLTQINIARQEKYNVDAKKEAWNKFLELSDGDRKIAKNFFVDVYSASEFDDIFGDD